MGPSSNGNNYAGFTSKPEDKYFDAYMTTNLATACSDGICSGYALRETSGWYSDYNTFVSSTTPWVARGSGYGVGNIAGVFGFCSSNGIASNGSAARSVIVRVGE